VSYSSSAVTTTSTLLADAPGWSWTNKFGIPDSCNENNTDSWQAFQAPLHTEFTFHQYMILMDDLLTELNNNNNNNIFSLFSLVFEDATNIYSTSVSCSDGGVLVCSETYRY
jgi:hypothetical protein